jgi:Rrf2 family transcriptional regulator, iron-sulfur cluster assembly transcription factor
VFRTETRHALRAMAALAQSVGQQMALAALSPQTIVPGPMLAKVLHRLSQADMVVGRPGPGGGYRLAKPAEEIRLREVVAVFEGPSFGISCLFGLAACSEENPCPLHPYWGEIRGRMVDMLDGHTVADLGRGDLELPRTRPHGQAQAKNRGQVKNPAQIKNPAQVRTVRGPARKAR